MSNPGRQSSGGQQGSSARSPQPRFSGRTAAVAVVAGLAAAGAPSPGALWAWSAPPIHGVVALTKSGLRFTPTRVTRRIISSRRR